MADLIHLMPSDDVATINEDTTLNGNAATNDTTDSGGTLTFSKASDPINGSVTVNSDGTFTYTPHSNFHGNAWWWTARDGSPRAPRPASASLKS